MCRRAAHTSAAVGDEVMPTNCVSVRRTKGAAKRGVHLERKPRFVLLGCGPAHRRRWRRMLLALCATGCVCAPERQKLDEGRLLGEGGGQQQLEQAVA